MGQVNPTPTLAPTLNGGGDPAPSPCLGEGWGEGYLYPINYLMNDETAPVSPGKVIQSESPNLIFVFIVAEETAVPNGHSPTKDG
jgi:hypothetical protein